MKTLPRLSVFTVCLLLSLQSHAQDDIPYHIYLNGNLQLGIPLGGFQDNLEAVGFGGGGLVLFQRKSGSPLFIGVEFSGMVYDAESLEFSFSSGGVSENYEWRTRNHILLGHALLRIQPAVDFPIWPYIDGLVGFKHLFTNSKLVDLNGEDEEVIERESNNKDWAFSYGLAAGLQFSPFRNPNIIIDLRLAYLPGETAVYLARREDAGNLQVEEPIELFEERFSPTTMLIPQIGVTIDFPIYKTAKPQNRRM